MSLIEYRNLLFEVSENIAWITESRRLLFICKVFLPDGCENDIQDVLSLLIKLEEENKLGIDSLEVLKDLLDGMGKWNLLQRVEKFENKRIEYKSLLEQCGRVLDECNQLERLISVCEGKISHDRREHITDVSTLFMELEKQNNLGIKRLEILKTMATVMEKPDLIEQVGEFEKKRKQEEDAERKQNELEEARRRSQVQTAAVLASARYAGRKLIGVVTPHCTFRNVAGGTVLVTTWMVLRRSSSLQEFVNTFTEAVLPLGNTLRAISEGSLCFTVQAETSSALEALWKTYQDGTLQRNLQEFLVTEDIKQLAGSEAKLTVKIDEQEYSDAVSDLITNETQAEKTDSDLSSKSAPSESGFYKDTAEKIVSDLRPKSAPSESGFYKDTDGEVEVKPKHQKQKRGSRVEFKCIYRGNEKASYRWFKDSTEMSSQNNSTLVLDCVELLDFGWYECQVTLHGGSIVPSAGELDVVPLDGMDYKRLSELDLNTKDEVGKLLLSRNTWREVAFKLHISSDEIDAQRDTGRDVMEFLEATKPDLKVYDLCKMLKNLKIQRFDIANLLLDHLSAPVTKRSQTP